LDNAESYDVIVIGGGPSGLMASIAARATGATTLLIEKGDFLGRKLGISGGGRCNVTNAKPLEELMRNIPGNGRFLHSALQRFSNEDIIGFFEGLGIRLKEEDRGRVFPVSDKASTVVKAMVDKVYNCGVEVWTETPVKSLIVTSATVRGVRLMNGRQVSATAIIVATGGSSVPKTGSTGDAYPWAKASGHDIIQPYPTEVPLTSAETFIQNRQLQGLAVRNTSVTIRDEKGKKLTTEHGDLLFTHLGLSGPVALRCSHYVSTALRRNVAAQLVAEIDCVPDFTAAELQQLFEQRRKLDSRRHFGNVLLDVLPERLATWMAETLQLDWHMQMAQVTNIALQQLVARLKACPVRLTGTLPLAQATVTGGGVSIKQINPKTMASKACDGLYFCGEVMDVHAHTGGYNITVAFSTGHCAGTNAGEYCLALQASGSATP